MGLSARDDGFWSIVAAAGYLELSERQLANQIGSGKVRTVILGGQRKIPDSEVERIRELREQDCDLYVIWEGDWVRRVCSRYAARLSFCSQDAIVDAFHRCELEGRRQGNTIEVSRDRLEAWSGRTLTFPGERPDPRRQATLWRL